MEEKEIVKLFLSHGFQLSQNTIPLIEKNPEKILSEIEKLNPRPFIVTKDHLNRFVDKKEEERTPQIKFLKKFFFEKKELKTEDYIEHFTKIYEELKDILLKKPKLTKLISINKITDETKEFSLISSVRDKGMNNLLVEDVTGETHVFFDEGTKKEFDYIELDDVLGFICKKEDEKIYIKNIIYPEVSVTRKINKTIKEARIFYIFKPSFLDDKEFGKLINVLRNTKKTDPIFVFGDWEDRETLKEFDNVFLILQDSQPCLFEIEDVKILGLPAKNSFENIIDKRLIKIDGLLNIFSIKEIPDIILSSNKETYSKNYKGVTIISNKDQQKYFAINLKSREVEEKNI